MAKDDQSDSNIQLLIDYYNRKNLIVILNKNRYFFARLFSKKDNNKRKIQYNIYRIEKKYCCEFTSLLMFVICKYAKSVIVYIAGSVFNCFVIVSFQYSDNK